MNRKRQNLLLLSLYLTLFVLGLKTLFHGFPDIERFFAEWMDERITLTAIMKFGTLNFEPTIIMHPPLYHYLTFIPIGLFFLIGKLAGAFSDKIEFIRFYFNNTQYFFLIGRIMSYTFHWLAALMIFKIVRLFYKREVAHLGTFAFLLIPRFIFDFSTTRPEPLLFLTSSIVVYFVLRYYLNNTQIRYLYLAAFFLGVSTATKYNALFLGLSFLPIVYYARRALTAENGYRGMLRTCLKIGFLGFLGFFLCNPFFILQFNKYFHNFLMYNRECRYYWSGPAVFGLTHIRQLSSLVYLNIFGVLIFILGSWNMWKKDKKLLSILLFTILVSELYFTTGQYDLSPLRYLNPLLALAVLIFASGISFILRGARALLILLVMFFVVITSNYFDIWRGLSFGPTHIQRARAYIEENVPEFTVIGIFPNSRIPQLNMTRASYSHLIQTAPKLDNIPGHELDYRDMDEQARYSGAFKEIRIESLIKSPRYNLIRWNGDIQTEEAAVMFFQDNKIKYLVSSIPIIIDGKSLEQLEAVSLVRQFKPNNNRVHSAILSIYRIGL